MCHETTEHVKLKQSSSKCAKKRKQKTHINLSTTSDIKRLSDIKYYVIRHFVEVLTVTESDMVPGKSKWLQHFILKKLNTMYLLY